MRKKEFIESPRITNTTLIMRKIYSHYNRKVVIFMMSYEVKGYDVPEGYMGFVDGQYMLFATESDYLDYIRDEEDED